MLFVLLILVTSTKILLTRGVPISNERWKNPCGSSSFFDASFLPPQLELISDMIVSLNEGIEIADHLRNKYAVERIRDAGKLQVLDRYHLGGFDMETITDDLISSSLNNINVSHHETYKYLSMPAIFLEQVKLDEDNLEHGAFRNDIVNSESKLYTILCHVYKAAMQLDNPIENYQSRDVMSEDLRIMTSKAYRAERDYIIAKDAVHSFKSTLMKYEAIKESLS